MTLRRRFVLYLLAVHLLFAWVAAYLLLQNRLWLLAVEVVFLLSFVVGYRLLHGLLAPLELVREGALLLADRDFATRLREPGQPEMDSLFQVYNRMAEQLTCCRGSSRPRPRARSSSATKGRSSSRTQRPLASWVCL